MQTEALRLRAYQILPIGRPAHVAADLGVDSLGKPIRAHLIPGHTNEVALIVAGVHGSEQSGVEVAERLLAQLQARQPYLTVVVVPKLFPDNVASRAAWEAQIAGEQHKIKVSEYRKLRDAAGDPGRTTPGGKDPNRQYPEPGKDLDPANPVDAKGKRLEPGNLALLALIKAFAPTRIVSIHAQKDPAKAGIFADPHPSVATGELATQADQLAIATAKKAKSLKARVAGNTGGKDDGTTFSSLYPGQDPKLAKEQMATENRRGISLGQWGPSKGIAVFTVECREQYRSDSAVDDAGRGAELEALATAINDIMLGPPGTAPPDQVTPGARPAPAGVQRQVVGQIAIAAGNRAAGIVADHLRDR